MSRASPELVREVYAKYRRLLIKIPGVFIVMPDYEEGCIVVYVESEEAAKRVREAVGEALEGVPVKIIIGQPVRVL